MAVAAVATFLADHGYPDLAAASARAAQEIADSDAYGARRYLQLNRELLDIIIFSPMNANAASDTEGGELTEELRRRHAVAFDLATTLLRRGAER